MTNAIKFTVPLDFQINYFDKVVHASATINGKNLREVFYLRSKFPTAPSREDYINWILNNISLCDPADKFTTIWGYSEEYLNSYQEGDWCPSKVDNMMINPLDILTGKTNGYLFTNNLYDGFVRDVDSNIVPRKIDVEFWQSYYSNLNKLEDILRMDDRFSDIKLERTPGYNIEIRGAYSISAKYNGGQEEIIKWINTNKHFGGSYGEIHNMPFIRKFLNA